LSSSSHQKGNSLATDIQDLTTRLASRFRQAQNPVVGYVHRGRFYIDLKAIPAEKNHLLSGVIEEVLSSVK